MLRKTLCLSIFDVKDIMLDDTGKLPIISYHYSYPAVGSPVGMLSIG